MCLLRRKVSMNKAIYPGSFDPVTLGHYDIIERSAKIFDHVMFSLEERVKMLQDVVSGFDNVSVEAFEGLLVDFVKQKNTNVIIRGLRALTDFDLEMQMAQSNRMVAPDVDTVFLSTSVEYSYLSSSVVKEYARYDVDVSDFVPDCVISKLIDKMKGL